MHSSQIGRVVWNNLSKERKSTPETLVKEGAYMEIHLFAKFCIYLLHYFFTDINLVNLQKYYAIITNTEIIHKNLI